MTFSRVKCAIFHCHLSPQPLLSDPGSSHHAHYTQQAWTWAIVELSRTPLSPTQVGKPCVTGRTFCQGARSRESAWPACSTTSEWVVQVLGLPWTLNALPRGSARMLSGAASGGRQYHQEAPSRAPAGIEPQRVRAGGQARVSGGSTALSTRPVPLKAQVRPSG